MFSIRQLGLTVLLGGCTLILLCGDAMAQMDLMISPEEASSRNRWQQKVLRRTPTRRGASSHKSAPAYRTAQRSLHQRPLHQGSGAGQEEVYVDSAELDMRITPVPSGGSVEMGTPEVIATPEAMGAGPMMGSDYGCGYGDCVDGGCGECGGCGMEVSPCGGGYGCYPTGFDCCEMYLRQLRAKWWGRDLAFFMGVHGFKGPLDQGRNGNFGIHEGLNWGLPFGGPFGLGWQVGFNAVHSNFSGDQVQNFRGGDRNQVFFTAAVFRRALCGGFQWGVAFDLLRDSYYEKVNLKQIRSETGFVFPGGKHELGYYGVYGVGTDRTYDGVMEPTDMFAVFYRRYFTAGGEGRIWGGITGTGNGLLGAEIRVPIGKHWAVENQFHYLLPKNGNGEGGGQTEEAWTLSMQLVWYFGQPARCVNRSQFRPMFYVADNSWFLTRSKGH